MKFQQQSTRSRQFKLATTAALVSILLSACGGGSDSSESVPTPQPQEITPFNGRVIDGYISGAQVFVDFNNNGKLDASEPTATSDDDGLYQLQLDSKMLAKLPTSQIIAIAGEGAIDKSTGEVFTDKPVVLIAPPVLDFDAQNSATFNLAITPFTTRVAQKTQSALEQLNAGEISSEQFETEAQQAKQQVLEQTSKDLGIKQDQLAQVLFADYSAPNTILSPDETAKLTQSAINETDNLQDEKSIEDQQTSELEDNQQLDVIVENNTMTSWQTGELLWLKEVFKEITTEQTDCKQYDWQVEKTRTDNQWKIQTLDGKPLVFETGYGSKIRCSDDTFNEVSHWAIDLNKDNLQKFKGQSYKIGQYTSNGKVFTEYFDESSVQIELPEWTNQLDRVYDDIDIKQAVIDNDLSKVDFVQKKEKTTIKEGTTTTETETYTEFSKPAFTNASYKETRVKTTFSDGEIHTIAKDWQADGSINEYISQAWYFENNQKTEVPIAFTKEWLAGRTLYNVWFGDGEKLDAQGDEVPLEDVAVVVQLDFKVDEKIIATGLLNTVSGETTYRILKDGQLQIDDNEDYNQITCDSTQHYIKTHYMANNQSNFGYDNTDLFFFDKQKALDFAKTLTDTIPACNYPRNN